MNIIELEPTRINAINNWFLKTESADVIACLENSAKKAMVEFAELSTKAKADNGNAQYIAAAQEKLGEAAEFQIAVKVLKSFFPDGPFIARIEL
jgi:hypothetical protein